ncbi:MULTISPECIES: SGNH/GDSL hydrolase family protein [unclassified Oleiphilus]|uniref:SGNH/GDSL hydrolase family protein n=1 Tax=unclassified Oleiphilus TaxID=2631174 RepID=UPI0008386A98|nr:MULTISPECIES: SGNH/GDSL hydrolase family protein [unclassified Oleiphilus]
MIRLKQKKLIDLPVKMAKAVKFAAACIVSVSVVGCTGNPYEEVADRNDVITLGDSIFDLNGVIQETLESYAGETFRDYTQSGAELSGGALAKAVDQQYEDAKSTDANIDTIVMDGGGNDILIPAMLFDPYGCRTHWWRWNISRSCRGLIEDQYINAINLLNQMESDDVQNVIWLGYYELPRGNKNLTKALNYGDDLLGYACDVATNASCSFVDTRGTVPASQVESDNIHPTPEGSINLANQIWPVLQTVL